MVFFGWVIFRSDTLRSAYAILSSMLGAQGFDINPTEISGGWFCLLAFLAAVIGPTSQMMAFKHLKPRTPTAIAIAGMLIYLTLTVTGNEYSEFLYFQF